MCRVTGRRYIMKLRINRLVRIALALGALLMLGGCYYPYYTHPGVAYDNGYSTGYSTGYSGYYDSPYYYSGPAYYPSYYSPYGGYGLLGFGVGRARRPRFFCGCFLSRGAHSA